MTDLEYLKEIVNTPAVEISKDDRAYVRRLAEQHGIEIKRKGCPSCYIDAAVLLFGKLSKEQETETKCQSPKYVLRDGVDVLFNGIRINAATINDELAERLISLGFDMSFFVQ